MWRKGDDLAEDLFLRAERIIEPMQQEHSGGIYNSNSITMGRIMNGLDQIYTRKGDIEKAARYRKMKADNMKAAQGLLNRSRSL
jgi:hypothetical protein